MDVDHRDCVIVGQREEKHLTPEEALQKRLIVSEESRKDFKQRCAKIIEAHEEWDMTQMIYSLLQQRCGGLTPKPTEKKKPFNLFGWFGGIFLALSSWCQRMANRKADRELRKKMEFDKSCVEAHEKHLKKLQAAMDSGWVETDEFWEVMWRAIQDTRPSVLFVKEGETTLQAMRRVIDENLKLYEQAHASEGIIMETPPKCASMSVPWPSPEDSSDPEEKKVLEDLMAEFGPGLAKKPILVRNGPCPLPAGPTTATASEIPPNFLKADNGAAADRGKVEDPVLEKLKEMKLKELLDKNTLAAEEQAILSDLLKSRGDIVVVK